MVFPTLGLNKARRLFMESWLVINGKMAGGTNQVALTGFRLLRSGIRLPAELTLSNKINGRIIKTRLAVQMISIRELVLEKAFSLATRSSSTFAGGSVIQWLFP